MLFILNCITLMGWNGKKRDHLWISVQFHPHIFILLEFHLDIRNGPSNFGINFSRSGFFKILLKDESVRMKLCISTIWSYDISSWKLTGLIPHSYIILTNQHQECICFDIWLSFSAAEKCGKFKFSIFFKKIKNRMKW